MGLDVFLCECCQDVYTEYERKYCGCGACICEYCIEEKGFEFNEDTCMIVKCSECNKPEMITITKARYDELINAEHFLDCLHGVGVDNWNGYSDAQEMFEEEE